jgi:ATP-dependent Clp protease ATP-binding subunit ClpA
MFKRYTEPARRVVYYARLEALHRDSVKIDTCDLALGLTRDPHTAECPFRSLHEQAQEFRAKLGAGPGAFAKPPAKQIPLSSMCKKALAYAEAESRLDRRYAIDREHVLRGILRTGDATAKVLSSAGWTLAKARLDSTACHRNVPDMKRPWNWWLRRPRRGRVFLFAGILLAAAVLYLHFQD